MKSFKRDACWTALLLITLVSGGRANACSATEAGAEVLPVAPGIGAGYKSALLTQTAPNPFTRDLDRRAGRDDA